MHGFTDLEKVETYLFESRNVNSQLLVLIVVLKLEGSSLAVRMLHAQCLVHLHANRAACDAVAKGKCCNEDFETEENNIKYFKCCALELYCCVTALLLFLVFIQVLPCVLHT
jgi:hypothetical protein